MDAQTIVKHCAQKPDEFLYLLVNALYPIEQDSALHVENLAQHNPLPVPRADLEHSPHLCPQLIILAMPGVAPNLDLVQVALEMALDEKGNTKRVICAFLTSADGPTEVARNLAAHCIVREKPEGPRRFMPLFEPQRLTLLQHTVPESWLNGWLGSIASWVYFDHAAQAQLLTRLHPGVWEETLPADALRAQNNARAVADLLLAWQRTGYAMPKNATQCALDQILAAINMGLKLAEDQLAFGLGRLTIHPHLERHPAVKSAIDNAIQGQQPLAQAFAAIPDAAWRSLTAQPAH